ncbi:hypothetical protein V5O48_004615 [Marasmius crinis-equi]|uniref:RRM domain-containing protein n=1 Tax=Marasmius crinis-equi TaxID=585013 RepID=A0ABR3FQB3_9AGAR
MHERAFLKFLDNRYAWDFLRSIRTAEENVGVHVLDKQGEAIEAWLIAAIGLRAASRCIIITPEPNGATKESLAADLARFGPVEKVEILSRSEKSYARVHFCNIRAAFKALKELREEGGRSVHFTPERNDAFLKQKLSGSRSSSTIPDNESFRTVLISGSKNPPSLLQFARLVRNEFPDKMVLRISMASENTNVYLEFLRPEDADFFATTFNSQIVKKMPELEGGNAHRIQQGIPQELPWHNTNRAVNLGAHRTIAIYRIPESGAFGRAQLFKDFCGFGTIARIRVELELHRAYIEYADITSAMRAIDQIRHRSPDFDRQRYLGTHITFAQPSKTSSILPLVIREEQTDAIETDDDAKSV